MFKKFVGQVIESLMEEGIYKATKFINSEYVIKATRKRYGGKIYKGSKTIDIVFTIGKPNYLERKFIQECIKAKEPFPVKKIQIKKESR